MGLNDHCNNMVVLWMRDRCAVNGAALRPIAGTYGGYDGKCISHTVDHCGDDHFNLANSELKPCVELLTAMLNATGGANKATRHWKTHLGKEWTGLSVTRWWARFELYAFLYDKFSFLSTFILTSAGDGEMEEGVRIKKLQDLFSNPFRLCLLKLELGASKAVCKKLVEATYTLEGSSASICMVARDVIDRCTRHLHQHSAALSYDGLPAMIDTAVVELHETQDAELQRREALRQQALAAIPPLLAPVFDHFIPDGGYTVNQTRTFLTDRLHSMCDGVREYFDKTILGELKGDLKRFETFRLLNPLYARQLQATPADFEARILELHWHFFQAGDAFDMCAEYPSFIQRAREIFPDGEGDWHDPAVQMVAIERFWQNNRADFHKLADFVRYIYTNTTSSASVERVFSMYKNMFSLAQLTSALQDLTEGGMKLRFNKDFINEYPEWEVV